MSSSPPPSPFMSLRPESRNRSRRSTGTSFSLSTRSFASLQPPTSPRSPGYVNGNSPRIAKGVQNGNIDRNLTNGNAREDSKFLRVASTKPDSKQDILLVHGPQQKYTLEHNKDLPELRRDDEILVEVLSIGLNPVDWKGPEYDFGQPSYPWVNGSDFAGVVVKGSKWSSRVQPGDVVFGPSTDYRDVRKAAYQEYLVTTSYNVARVPQSMSAEECAPLGVAFVAATITLGICFGLDFSTLDGPDLLRMTHSMDPENVADDIRDEVFGGMDPSERLQSGDWLAIWGASSTTGMVAVQLAKLAGLKVVCVADVANTGAILTELGADVLIDRHDHKRAIEIIRSVTGGKLRFGFDAVSKKTAGYLEEALQQSPNGQRSHLLGLAGLHKQTPPGVTHHDAPMKIFHEVSNVGEQISRWLEKLLLAKHLKLPEVDVAKGGLAGVNNALDRLRSGEVSGQRIVVPVNGKSDNDDASASRSPEINGVHSTTDANNELAYADQLNSDPDRVKFAYWVPNVSGGLVISKIPQRTSWDLKANVRYARTAERVGFEYALSQIRFMAGYGADNQHEPVSFSQALLSATEKLKVIAALLPGPWNPAVAAKMIASIDNYTDGRVCVNVVSGWFRAEFASIGQWWLEHAERYRRSREFIECLKGIWTNETFTYNGDFYQFHDYPLKPKPLAWPGRPHPEIFQGGNSDDAKENAGSVSDYYFMNGNTLEGFQQQIADVKEKAKKNGREGQVKFALNAFVICRETEDEAIRVLQEIQGKADKEAVEGFRQQVQNAGASTTNKSGMWANSKFEDLVQYNDGFKTKLIGTKEQIADRICLLKSLGVSIILTAFLHYEEEIEQFGTEILPLVRELEKQGRGSDEAFEVAQTGDVYRERHELKDEPAKKTVNKKEEKPKDNKEEKTVIPEKQKEKDVREERTATPEKQQNGTISQARSVESKTAERVDSVRQNSQQSSLEDDKSKDSGVERKTARRNSSFKKAIKGFGRRFSFQRGSN